MEDVPSTSRDKTRRGAVHILENLLDYDPNYEEDLPFIQLFQELACINRIDGLITTSCENLRTLYSNLSRKTNNISFCSILKIKKLRFFLKHFQEKGNYEIGANFDYSSIDDNGCFDFMDHHFWDSNNETDPRPVSTFFPSRKLLDSLESKCLDYEGSSLPFNGEPASSSCDIKGCTSSASESINVSFTSREENHDVSIESSASTLFTRKKETPGTNEKPHSNSKRESETVSFRDTSFRKSLWSSPFHVFRSSKNNESPFRQSMWSSPAHVFKSSNLQDPSDCEINEASDIDTSKNLERPSDSNMEFLRKELRKSEEFKNVLETVLFFKPRFEKYLSFMSLFREVTSQNGIEELVLLYKDELRLLHYR